MRVQFNNGRHFSSMNGFIETPPKFVKYVTNIQQMWLKNNYMYIVLTFHDGWCIVHK